MSASILTNGRKDFADFRCHYSPISQVNRTAGKIAMFVMVSRTTLITSPYRPVLMTEPTNQRTVKKVNQGSSLVYHITGYFP